MAHSKSRKAMISILMIIVVLLSMTSIYADTASITINLKSYDNLGDPAGVNFAIYKVGNVDQTTHTPVFDSKYGINAAPKTAADVASIIAKLKKADKGNPVTTGATSSGGTLNISVDTGIYYIEAGDNNYGVIEPSVVWLPYYSMDDSDLSYRVEITPKAEPNDNVLGEIKDPTDGAVQGEESNPKVLGEEAKTSDDAQFYGLIGLALLSILMIMFIISRKNRRKEQNDAL